MNSEIEDLISVIVPVFNVEPYIEQCIKSIVDQTYKKIEIILVDDGSSDQGGAICDCWAASDDRIRVIHQDNQGLSAARNAGLAISKGEYISFIDSDDWIEMDMLEVLHERITDSESDIVICGVMVEYESGSSSKEFNKDEIFTSKEALISLLSGSEVKDQVWDKLYRRSAIGTVQFPIGKFHEDLYWSYQVIVNVDRISLVSKSFYHYRQRSTSIMGMGYSIRRLDAMEAKKERFEFFEQYDNELALLAYSDCLLSCFYHYQKSLIHLCGTERKEATQFIQNCFSSLPIFYNNLEMKYILLLLLAKIGFKLPFIVREKLGFGN